MKRRRFCPPIQTGSAAFAGFRFPPEVILFAVRWYLRYGLSYRDLEELLAERGIEVDHVHSANAPPQPARDPANCAAKERLLAAR